MTSTEGSQLVLPPQSEPLGESNCEILGLTAAGKEIVERIRRGDRPMPMLAKPTASARLPLGRNAPVSEFKVLRPQGGFTRLLFRSLRNQQ